MEISESVASLAADLAKAQKEFKSALKDSKAYGYNYADMSTVRESVIDALTKYNLTVVQAPITDEEKIGVSTMLLHSSGEWIRSKYLLPLTEPGKGNTFPQMVGSSITYYRRYALLAMLNLAPEDDDGQAGGQRYKVEPSKHPDSNTRKPQPMTDRQKKAIEAICSKFGIENPNVTTFDAASKFISEKR